MKILCAVLTVIIIVLVVALVLKYRQKPTEKLSEPEIVVRTVEKTKRSPEAAHVEAQAEFFSNEDAQFGTDIVETSKQFDGIDGDFKDWVASKAVGADVIKNHREFVNDRIGPQSNYTGRNMTLPDSSDLDNYSNWMGIRGRPRAVRIDNPDTVADDDVSQYASKNRITINGA